MLVDRVSDKLKLSEGLIGVCAALRAADNGGRKENNTGCHVDIQGNWTFLEMWSRE